MINILSKNTGFCSLFIIEFFLLNSAEPMERQRLEFDELIDQRLSQVINKISYSYLIISEYFRVFK